MRIFSPKRYVASVDRIDLDALWADGKRAILLDRDNTNLYGLLALLLTSGAGLAGIFFYKRRQMKKS